MGMFVYLNCDTCKKTFSYTFTQGCIRTGEAITQCPNCNATIKLVEGSILPSGDFTIDIIGARRGLQVIINPLPNNSPLYQERNRQIYQDVMNGKKIKDIAQINNISTVRVYQIVQQEKRKLLKLDDMIKQGIVY